MTLFDPEVSCRELFERAKALLDEYHPGAFFHHLGHGVGLYPHEAPHLNPNWDDRFAVGDVFTVEPGLYTEALRAGIRIEENFLVTQTVSSNSQQHPPNSSVRLVPTRVTPYWSE